MDDGQPQTQPVVGSTLEARTRIRGGRLPLLVGAPILALLAALLWSMPVLHIVMVIHDAFVPLDDGWRAAGGQLPHVGHHSPMGPLYDAVAWGAQALGGSDPAALARMNALALLLLSPLLLSAGARIHAGGRGVLWILALALLAVSPRYLGHPPSHAAWMAAYNRWCWSALAAVALLCVLKPKADATWRDGLALGWGLVFLGTVKITFALAGAFGLALCCILLPWLRRPAAAAFAVAAASAALLLLFPVGRGYLDDLLWAAELARGSEREFGPLQILLLDKR